MKIRIQADTDTEGVGHRYYPDSKFGTLDFHNGGHGNYLYFFNTADIDAVIAELVALKQKMDPPGCPSTAPETGRPCTETGEHDRHRNGMVVWSDEPAGPCGECHYALDKPDHDEMCGQRAAFLAAPEPGPLPLACGCSVPLGHLNLFQPGHPVECVLHGPTTVAGPATPEERLLLAVHGVSPDNPANVRELRTHEAECTLTDHTPCLAHLAGQTASVTA